MAVPRSRSLGRPTATHRPDIDALRAVAIVLVVLYHAQVSAFTGGFVGVDVFFAISGYLITRNLLIEHAGAGRIALRSFWARRLRRLVPAMSVMVAVTMAIGMAVLTPLQWSELAAQGLAASLYVANVHFARVTGDYFAAGVESAPLLHTWSLAVEEQFYLVWPVLVGGALRLAVALRRSTAAIVAVLGVVAVASFAWSVALVGRGSIDAFYGLPARTWEFAVAGLLAVLTTRVELRIGTKAQVALALGGAAAIVATGIVYDADTAFPGIAALAPVLGTCALILAGSGSGTPFTWRTAIAPVRWLGRISYSWYLWHWPAMVLAVAWTDHDTVVVRLVAALTALCVAQLSLAAIEDPVRRSPRLVRSRPATLGVGLAFTLVAVGSTIGVQHRHDTTLQQSFYRDIAAASDKRYLDDCTWSTFDGDEDLCTLGDPEGSRTVLLMGDSHAMSWAPSFHLAGRELGVRILVRAASSCPAVPVPTMSEYTGHLNRSCMDYRDATIALAHQVSPDLVVLVSSDFTRRVATPDGVRIDDRDQELATWATALGGLRDDLQADGMAVGAILDNPRVAPDPLTCMEDHRDLAACTPTRAQALRRVRLHVANERRVLGADATLDTISMSCGDQRCEIWKDGQYVYADATHLSAGFTEAHVDDLIAFLRRFAPFAPPRLAQGPGGEQTEGP